MIAHDHEVTVKSASLTSLTSHGDRRPPVYATATALRAKAVKNAAPGKLFRRR